MNPYREITLLKPKHEHKNVFRYVIHNYFECPVCDKNVDGRAFAVQDPFGIKERCHPLKRISVRGALWLRKYCPVGGIHYHCYCYYCNVKWIAMASDQKGAEPEINETYI